jgi:hypothetical protein
LAGGARFTAYLLRLLSYAIRRGGVCRLCGLRHFATGWRISASCLAHSRSAFVGHKINEARLYASGAHLCCLTAHVHSWVDFAAINQHV